MADLPNDPSMEDILSSIKSILSDDEKANGQARADDVLVLDPQMMVETAGPAAPALSQTTETAAMSHSMNASTPDTLPPLTDSLVAPAAATAAANSVGSLVRTLAARGTQTHTAGPTIEDIVRDEIRPVLKQWLDVNLPALVEKQVRAEIERVVARAAL